MLPQGVLARKTHGPKFAIQLAGKAAIGVYTPAQPVLRFQNGDGVPGFLQQQGGRQPGHTCPNDDDMTWRLPGRRQAIFEHI